MLLGIYSSFIIHIFVMFYGVITLAAEIKGIITGLNGENGTAIECSYTLKDITLIKSVSFLAYNRSSISFHEIAVYIPNSLSFITDNGQYLKGRVTLMNITQSTRKAVITFNKLTCIDDTLYQCEVDYINLGGSQTFNSKNTTLSVQVPPSKPDHVLIVHTPADSSLTSTKNMVYRSSLPPTEVTSTWKESTFPMQNEIQNKTTAFNDSTIPKTNYQSTSSIPLNDDFSFDNKYRTTPYSTQQTTTERGIAEGDTITVTCAGDVGKPPAKLIFQKLVFGQIISVEETGTSSSTSDISANCSYYRTSNITFQVTAADNNAVIRCVVKSSMADPDMYVETEPIEVYYPVRMPTIINYPHKTDYVVGEETSIRLACKSDGNPKPSYVWYKENPKQQVSSNENFTITNITNSGNYTCEVNNTFHGDTYLKAAIVKIKIMNTADKTTPSTSGSWLNKAKDNGTVYAIAIVVVLIVIGVVVVLIVLLYRRIKEKKEYKPVDRMELNMDQIETTQIVPTSSSTKKTIGYEDIDLDDTDMKFKILSDEETIAKVKQHNEEYLKKLKEDEETEKDNPTQPPQPAVYACVNKPKSTVTTENKPPAGQQEEDVYEDSKEGLYDTSGDRRHKENSTLEYYDSTEKFKNEESDYNDLFSEQNGKIGANINKLYGNSEHKEEKRQVATVSPTVRMSSSSQGDGQKRKSDEIQPKTEKLTTQETFL